MTTAEWITQTFSLDERGNIVLETFSDGATISIDPTTLATVLSEVANIAPTHADLSALPVASVGGWQKYFDDWKTKGLIS